MAVLGVDRESARRALLSGVAGQAVRTRGATLYDADAIDALVDHARVTITPEDAPGVCRRGVFVGRLGPRRPTPQDDWRSWRGADASAPLREQLDAASAWWRLALMTRILIGILVEQDGYVPFLGTVASFVLVGGEITDARAGPASAGDRATRLELRPAGRWFATFERRRISGPAGGPWYGWPDGIWNSLDRIAG